MALMGKKLTAAQALEGRFSSEGLVALAGEDANVEIALARSLVECMDEGDTRRLWNKVANPREDQDFDDVPESLELPVERDGTGQLWLEGLGPVLREVLPVRQPRRRIQAKGRPSRPTRVPCETLLF